MSATNTLANVRIGELHDYIRQGRILDAMKEFYADDVVMTEPYHTTHGLAANIEREKQFLASVKEWKNFDARATAIAGDVSLSEQVMDWVGVDGKPVHAEQVAVARWKNGKIVHERFYYNMK